MREDATRRSVWSVPDMRIVLPGRALSAAGTGMAMVAMVLHLHAVGAGPAATAALMITMALPTVALMGVAGRVADSRGSRGVLVVGHLAQVVAFAGLALAAGPLGDHVPWWGLMPLVLLGQTGIAFAAPVWTALVPRIVGEERIGQAVAWQQGLSTAVSPLGAAASGVLYGLVGPAAALGGAAMLEALLVVAAACVRTRRTGGVTGSDRGEGAERVRGGLSVIRTDGVLGPLLAGLLVLVVCVEGVNVVEVFLARDSLGATPEQYGFTEFAFAGGAVLGAVLAGRIVSSRIRLCAVILGFGLASVSLVGSGLAPNFWVYLAACLAVGLTVSLGNAANGALMMERVADAERGRVASVLGGTTRAASLVALTLGGLAGTWLGPRPTFVAAGLGGAAVAVVLLVWAVRRRDEVVPGREEVVPS